MITLSLQKIHGYSASIDRNPTLVIILQCDRQGDSLKLLRIT